MKNFKLLMSVFSGILLMSSNWTGAFAREKSVDDFSLNLLKEVVRNKPNSNALISPYSVSSALTMTYNGASGKTREDMARVLAFSGGTDTEINERARTTMRSLKEVSSGTRLEVASALFARQDVEFKKDFLMRCKEYYGAGTKSLDFGNPKSVSTINSWVSENTNKKIPEIIEKISPDAILYLINAIYFKGDWMHKFDKAMTLPMDFQIRASSEKANVSAEKANTTNSAKSPAKLGEKIKVPMMRMTRSDFAYLEEKDFQAINLSYKDPRLSLYLFLPSQNSSLAEFEKNLDAEKLNQVFSRFRKSAGHLSMPRFKINDFAKLKEPLSRMGMNIAFDENKADFERMAKLSDRIYIMDVLHKTFMEVNEEGTEAAAATAVIMGERTARLNTTPPFVMNIDRPFFLVLRDNKSKTNLFIGRIVDPRGT